MEPKKPYHHGDLKQALLNQALKVLENAGLDFLSLRDLAQSVGVSKTAPYRHFQDKEKLLTELAAEGFALLAQDLEEATGSGPGRPGADTGADAPQPPLFHLRQSIKAYVEFAQKRPQLYRMMFSRVGYGLHSERCKVNADRAMGCLVKGVALAQAADWRAERNPHSLALSVWGLAHGWAGMLTENLVPPEASLTGDAWLESAMDLLRP